MRFHEFYRFQEGKIIEVQALWDIPELMMQSNSWPMAPTLGREWCIPGPATMDGISDNSYDTEKSSSSVQIVIKMLEAMKKHPSQGGPELMEMDFYWHPKMNWYGPSGIGSGRGVEGFRNWHQIPFLNAMPDRGKYIDQSQSLNLFLAKPNFQNITSMHFYAWNKGLKCCQYYLRTKAKAATQKFTIAPSNSQESEEESECEACGS